MSGSEIVRKFYEQYFAPQSGGRTQEDDDDHADDIAEEVERLTAEYGLSGPLSEKRREVAKRMQENFERAVSRLDEQDRRIVEMRHFEELTNQEVARVLELSEPEASMRYLRAMRKLREMMLGEEEE